MRRLRWLRRSVQNLTEGIGPQGRRLVLEFVLGVIRGGSVVLSEIARQLHPTKAGFEACLERLSRGLARSRTRIGEVAERYLRRAGRHTWSGYDVIAVDLTDLAKRWARRMPYLCQVRDASERRRQRRTVVERGWWLVEVVATAFDHRTLPLHCHPFSSVHPDFVSQNDEIRKAIARVSRWVSPDALWVADRGFDGNTIFALFAALQVRRWLVRLRSNRHVRLAGHTRSQWLWTLARAIAKNHVARPYVSRDGRLVRIEERFGYCTVQLERDGDHHTLLAVDRADGEGTPMILLTRDRPRNAAEAAHLVEAYYRRWAAEDQARADKQLMQIENVRVLTWQRLVNVCALTVVASGQLALRQAEAPTQAEGLAREAPVDHDVPPFALYRIWMTVALILRRSRLVT